MPLLLAAVLISSAIAKLRERGATGSAIVLLRLPRFLQRSWVTWALPVGEIALALALLLPWSPVAVAAALATLVLMVTYWAVIARAMTFDPRPSCGCFGRIGDQTVSERTLVRNSLLVLAAGLGLWWSARGHTVWTTLATFGLGEWCWLLVVVLAAAVAVLILGRSAPRPAETSLFPAPVPEADPEEYVRAPVPPALLQDPTGRVQLLLELVRARAQLLIFYTCACPPAIETDALVPEWQRRLAQLDVLSVATFVPQPGHFQQPLWLDHGSLAYLALRMTGHPSAVLLGADGLLAGGPVEGLDQIRDFVDEIEAVLAEAAAAGGPEPVHAEGPAETL